MTTCTECTYDWDGPPERTVVVISAFPGRLSQLLIDLGPRATDSRLRTRPAAEVWSPLECMAHTGDAIAWYAERIKSVLTENRPALDPFDWDTHTAAQRYHERSLTDVLATVRSACAKLTADLETLTVTAWEREGTGSDGSARTVAQLAERAGHEAQHHLHDIALGLDAPGGARIHDGRTQP